MFLVTLNSLWRFTAPHVPLMVGSIFWRPAAARQQLGSRLTHSLTRPLGRHQGHGEQRAAAIMAAELGSCSVNTARPGALKRLFSPTLNTHSIHWSYLLAWIKAAVTPRPYSGPTAPGSAGLEAAVAERHASSVGGEAPLPSGAFGCSTSEPPSPS